MQRSQDQFFLQHGGEIRESLIMIEGDDGSLELLAHSWLAGKDGDDPHSPWSEAAIPVVYTCWSARPIAIPGKYTTGIGSEPTRSVLCRIGSLGCGARPRLKWRAAPTGSSVHQKSR
jgi:hypothetical protein